MGKPFTKSDLDNFIGTRQGSIVVVSHLKKGKNKTNYFCCKCDCGRIVEIRVSHFIHDHQTTCGRHHKKYSNATIGAKIYNTWNRMIARCYRPHTHKYYRYGARGITVCDEWRNNYDAFYQWCISNGYQEGLSLDRIDNDGNYTPNNCRWATRTQQQRNMCRNKLITYKGQTRCLAEWCELLNLKYQPILKRLNRGYTPQRAFETPIKSRG